MENNPKKKTNFYGIFFVMFLFLLASGLIVMISTIQAPATGLVKEGSTTSTKPKILPGADVMGVNEIRLTDQNFQKEVLSYKGVALVEFYLTTCGYCQQVGPEVTAAANQLKGKAKVGRADATKTAKMAERFRAQKVPTFVVFKNGIAKERIVGVQTKSYLVELVEKYL